jgi:hypothetical protein
MLGKETGGTLDVQRGTNQVLVGQVAVSQALFSLLRR